MINFKVTKRLNLNCFHHIKPKENCDIIKVLANTTDVIILQYVSVSNQHIVNLKLTHFFKKRNTNPRSQKSLTERQKQPKSKRECR